MSTIMKASHQWATRPHDERFLSLTELAQATAAQKERSKGLVLDTKQIQVRPVESDQRALVVQGPDGSHVAPTHHAFTQLCALASGTPSGYMRQLPTELVADCLNVGLAQRDVDDIGVYLRAAENRIEVPELLAATGPTYGRVYNSEISAALLRVFGDGPSARYRVPGEFGRPVPITRENTTLYAGDRDMFVFLADETDRNMIEIQDRRDGKAGLLSHGAFFWNSEVGAGTLGVASFWYDYVCCNRIVWGATGYQEIKIRHTSGAPGRWIEQAVPAIEDMVNREPGGMVDLIKAAQAKKVDDVDKLLQARFTKSQAKAIQAAHVQDEGRPIETLWDVTTGATAYARSISYQNERVAIERTAGQILGLAA